MFINTYHLEELTSTKLRALYDRRKGRDIYDLYRISQIGLEKTSIRKMVLYYFYRTSKVFHYTTFIQNIERKMAERSFRDDLGSFIRNRAVLEWQVMCQRVLQFYTFLGELDERDLLFLDLAKYLLGKPYPKIKKDILQTLIHPLAWLMNDLPISLDAQNITQEEIKLYF